MPSITARIEKSEQSATAAQPRVTGWASLWARMRSVYGDKGTYSADELARLDHTPPPTLAEAEAMLARDADAVA